MKKIMNQKPLEKKNPFGFLAGDKIQHAHLHYYYESFVPLSTCKVTNYLCIIHM